MKNTLKPIFILLTTVILFPNGYLRAEQPTIPEPEKAKIIFQQVDIASSPNPVGSGARALGMGSAFIAIADDATAASWNPAGLVQLERLEFSVVGAYLCRQEDFFSNLSPEIANSGEIDESNINYVSIAFPFKLFHRNVVMSMNYQRLYEFKRSFDYHRNFSSDGTDPVQYTKYINFRQCGYIGALGLASAIQITPYLSLGTTINIWTDRLFWRNGWNDNYFEHHVRTSGVIPFTSDSLITDKYTRFQGINFNFGFLWEINQYFMVGAVVKTPFKANLRHEFRFINTSTLDTVTTISKTKLLEDIELHMPSSYGMGLALRISDALSLSLDVYRTEWSDYSLLDGKGNKYSPIDGQPKDSSDVNAITQVRLGGEFLFIGKDIVVPLRGGFFYDPEPSPGNPEDFYGISIGSGLVYKKICFDAAYQFRWARDIDTGNLIADSKCDIKQHLVLASVIIHL